MEPPGNGCRFGDSSLKFKKKREKGGFFSTSLFSQHDKSIQSTACARVWKPSAKRVILFSFTDNCSPRGQGESEEERPIIRGGRGYKYQAAALSACLIYWERAVTQHFAGLDPL